MARVLRTAKRLTKTKSAAALEREGLRYGWMKIGVPVWYHCVPGEPPDFDAVVRGEPRLLDGRKWVCLITGVSGCVACEAVSFRDEGRSRRGAAKEAGDRDQ